MPEGEFIAPDGTVCGTHKGILHYTVGQRKRLGIALGEPVFIQRIDASTNRIYLARAGEDVVRKVVIGELTSPDGNPFPESSLVASSCVRQPSPFRWRSRCPEKRQNFPLIRRRGWWQMGSPLYFMKGTLF